MGRDMSKAFHRKPFRFLAMFVAAIISAATLAFVTPSLAAAIYYPGAEQWDGVYLPDGSYQGASLNRADYYTWSDGTESVSNMYGGLNRSYNNPGTSMIWKDAWLHNYDGTVPLYVTWGGRADCGLGCEWDQNVSSGWQTIRAQSQYCMMVHGVYWGCCRGYSQPVLALWWP